MAFPKPLFVENSPALAPAVPASRDPSRDGHESARTRPGGTRRRDKVQLSCDLCRRRK
jgi:hypothetical protein